MARSRAPAVAQLLLQEPVDAVERQLARLAPARQRRVGIGSGLRAGGPQHRGQQVGMERGQSRPAWRAPPAPATGRRAAACGRRPPGSRATAARPAGNRAGPHRRCCSRWRAPPASGRRRRPASRATAARRAMPAGAPIASKAAARSASAALSDLPDQRGRQVAQRRHGRAELLGRRHGVERLRQAAQGPLHGARQEALRGDQHAGLRLGLQRRVERFDVAPQVAQLPGVAHHGEGARDRRGRRAGAQADRRARRSGRSD